MKHWVGFILMVGLAFTAQAKPEQFTAAEDSLVKLLTQTREVRTDAERNKYNAAFKSYLLQTIKQKGAMNYAFGKLHIGTLTAPDNSFRLFNWNIENDDRTHQYFCYMLHKVNGEMTVTELKDRTSDLRKPESQSLHSTHWYGALYYQIIPIKRKGKKYYTVLGWKGKDRMTTQKVIDVITISKKGLVKLGAPVFKTNKGMKRRVIFTYDASSRMSLRFQKKSNRIVFDHLAAEHGLLEDAEAFQRPTLDFDAFVYKKGKWYFTPGIDPRNENGDRREWNEPEENPLNNPRR